MRNWLATLVCLASLAAAAPWNALEGQEETRLLLQGDGGVKHLHWSPVEVPLGGELLVVSALKRYQTFITGTCVRYLYLGELQGSWVLGIQEVELDLSATDPSFALFGDLLPDGKASQSMAEFLAGQGLCMLQSRGMEVRQVFLPVNKSFRLLGPGHGLSFTVLQDPGGARVSWVDR